MKPKLPDPSVRFILYFRVQYGRTAEDRRRARQELQELNEMTHVALKLRRAGLEARP